MYIDINSVWDISGIDGLLDGKYRVLQLLPRIDSVALYHLRESEGISRPVVLSMPIFKAGIRENRCLVSIYKAPFYQLESEELIPIIQKRKRDENWQLIKELINSQNYLEDIITSERSRKISQYAKSKGTYVQKIYRLLNLYWRYGQHKNALLPAYKLSGAKGIPRTAGTAKRGAPPKDYIPALSPIEGKNVTEHDKKIFKRAMKKYGLKGKEVALSRVYDQMLKDFYYGEILLADSQERDPTLPSLRSFRYWIKKLFGPDEILRKQTNKGDYERNKRGLRGSATDHTQVIGSCFEIDATVIDVHIVSEFNRNTVLGRPTLYCVIDKESRMIVGLHVSLEYASWRAGRQALVNSFTPKKNYCARFGIDIEEAEWPCYHIPQRLLCDRGEFICKKPEELAVPLIGHISIAPPYRADLKGIVERRFKIFNDRLLHELKGTTNGRHYIRGDKDPRLDAQFTITEITSLLIDEVLEHNNSIFQDLARSSPLLIESELPPTPINYWNLHLEKHLHSLSVMDESEIRACLLPPEKVSMTSRGIRLNNNLYYESDDPDFEDWKSIARTNGRWPLDARIDQDNASYIYVRLQPNRGFTRCSLVSLSSNFDRKHIADVGYFHNWLERETKRAKPNTKSLERHERRKEIVTNANELQKQSPSPKSQREKIHAIKANRRKAIEQGRFSSMQEEAISSAPQPEKNVSEVRQNFDNTDSIISLLKRTRGTKNEN
jgi:hypothetical protein